MTMSFLCLCLVVIYVYVSIPTIRREINDTVSEERNGVKLKRILFYNPRILQRSRHVQDSFNSTFFEQCQVKNCIMTFNKSDAPISDAIILYWGPKYKNSSYTIMRPRDQVWIFNQHEPTASYKLEHFDGMQNIFNWTMTYSQHSDLPLPYGALKLKPTATMPKRDYLAIAKNKTKDAIWIVSHCPTRSKREEYVDILKQYIDIDILGKCGQKWDCGRRSYHEAGDCFSILNSTYRYFIAFENSLCDEYISEKFHENYKYDIIPISRAGDPKHRSNIIDKNVYISTADFKDAHELGKYLQKLSLDKEKYAKFLSDKDMYEPISYVELLHEQVCEICMRLNKLEDYKKVYEDVYSWMMTKTGCYKPTDI